MSFEVAVSTTFSAAHAIKGMTGECEKLHGHNWKVEVSVITEDLDERGVSIDYRELRSLLQQTIRPMDHSVLNEVPELENISPTCESLARYIYDTLAPEVPPHGRLALVRVWESEYSSAAYAP